VVQLLQDGQRLLPGVPGQGQGSPVALAGLVMPAEMVLSEPDAVPGSCLAVAVAGLVQRL